MTDMNVCHLVKILEFTKFYLNKILVLFGSRKVS